MRKEEKTEDLDNLEEEHASSLKKEDAIGVEEDSLASSDDADAEDLLVSSDDADAEEDLLVPSDDADTEDSKFEKLKKERDNLLGSLQQERAEFLNYKKRVMHEKSELEGYTLAKVLKEMFPLLDSFNMFFMSFDKQMETDKKNKSTFDFKKMREGVVLLQKQALDTFIKSGVEELDPVNEPFDPAIMEAVGMQETDQVEESTVAEVLQRGYMLKSKVLRPARVFVHKPKQS